MPQAEGLRALWPLLGCKGEISTLKSILIWEISYVACLALGSRDVSEHGLRLHETHGSGEDDAAQCSCLRCSQSASRTLSSTCL